MFFVGFFVFLQSAFAWEKSGGAYGGSIAYRTSAGNHRAHIGMGGWFQNCRKTQTIQPCWQAGVSIATNGQNIPGGTMRTTLVRPTVSVGYILGTQPTKIGFSGGMGAQVIAGGVNGDVLLVQPGGYGMISVQKPVKEDWLLWVSNGYFMRAWGVDTDMSIGVGKRW